MYVTLLKFVLSDDPLAKTYELKAPPRPQPPQHLETLDENASTTTVTHVCLRIRRSLFICVVTRSDDGGHQAQARFDSARHGQGTMTSVSLSLAGNVSPIFRFRCNSFWQNTEFQVRERSDGLDVSDCLCHCLVRTSRLALSLAILFEGVVLEL